jgi:hypothetical protein
MKTLFALFLLAAACPAAHAQTGWTYHAGPISPMTDVRVDRLTVRSTEPIRDQAGNFVFGFLTVDCSPGGPHPVWFSSRAQLDADLTGATALNMRFGEDEPTGLVNLPLYRDGSSILLPSSDDATARKMANYERLRMQIEVHGQPDQFLDFSIGGLRTVAESHNCAL